MATKPSDDLHARNSATTSETEIGAIAKPDEIRFTAALPKTRSGKIMRRLLKEICAGGDISGDTTTLEDRSILASPPREGKGRNNKMRAHDSGIGF